MSEGCDSLGGRTPFDLNEVAKRAIALGMTLEEFDRLDFSDIEIVFDGLIRRYELTNEGVMAQLIRQNTYITACYAPFFKSSEKPKQLTDIHRFSHEKEAVVADKADSYKSLANYLNTTNQSL